VGPGGSGVVIHWVYGAQGPMTRAALPSLLSPLRGTCAALWRPKCSLGRVWSRCRHGDLPFPGPTTELTRQQANSDANPRWSIAASRSESAAVWCMRLATLPPTCFFEAAHHPPIVYCFQGVDTTTQSNAAFTVAPVEGRVLSGSGALRGSNPFRGSLRVS